MSGFWWNSICSSPVWNSHVSWNTTDPDFTPCFQKTVLYWIPCGFLFLAVPLHLVTVCKQNNTDAVPHSWLNLTKTILLTFLAAVCLADLFRWVHLENQDLLVDAADFLQSSCLLISFGLCLLCVQYGRMKGVRSTGVLFIFWLLLCICDIVVFRSKIRHAVFRGGVNDIFSFVTFTLHFVIVLVQLVLSCLMDRPPIGYNQSDRSSEENAPFLSRVTFWWFTGMVFTGYRRSLVDNDLCGLNEDDKCGNVAPVLRGHWKRELEKSKSKGDSSSSSTTNNGSSVTEDKNGSIEKGKEKESVPLKPMLDTEETGVEIKSGKQIYEPSLVKALARGFGPYFLSGSILKLVHDVMVFINPQILRLLIEFTTDKSQPRWLGFLYAGVMFISALFQSLILQQYFHRCTVTGMRIRGSLVAAVYRKSLRLSNSAKRKTTTGEIVNLMSVDAQRFMDLTTYINMVWSAPVQISIALYFLWQTLGPSVLAGLGVMILLMPINALLAHFTRKYQMAQMKHKDERIKLMNEILNGIKVLKLYAWEQSFMDRVLGIRSKELGILKKNAYLNGGITFAWNCAPFIVSLVTFAVYVLSSPDNVLDAQRAFVALSLFNILRFPLFALPMVISSCVQANVSIHRLTEFFKHEELENGAVTNFKQSGSALKITDGTFKWERSDSPILENINVDLKPGSLVAVVGSVGAGKSSLLSAALGDMEKCKGTINVDGSVSYVSQQAWIQNSTLRDNILFNQSYEDETYWKVMNACALKPDLEQLTSGDQTEIGEKGINLSGGQKQRVSLARAVYNNADIYLMDDPLSAVDAHVGKHIFENVIGPSGMLSDKTRILVTHGISFLPQVDLIIVLEDGQVKEMGSYNQLMDHAGPFAEFLRNYLEEEEEELSEMSDDEKSLRDEIIHNLEPIFGTIHHGSAMKLAGSKMSLHSNAQCLSNLSLHKLKSRESLHASLPRLQQLRSHESHGSRSPALKRQHSSRQNTEEKIIPKTDEEKDKLIVTETAETGTVKLAVFGTYIKAISIPVSLLILLLFALSYTAAIGQNIWLSDWSDEVTQNGGNITDARRDLRLAVYGALGLAQGIFDFLSAMSMAAGGIKASKHLHFKLLHRILHASYQFLERVTIGRILNRFTEDIADVDLVMPFTVRSVINTVLAAVGTVAIVTSTTPLFLCILPAAGIVYFIIQSFTSTSYSIGILVMFSTLRLALAALAAASSLHHHLLDRIFRSPMSFFDTTPIGRIVNRFSKDIDTIDIVLREKFDAWLRCAFSVIGTILVISTSTPFILTIIVPLCLLFIGVQRFYVCTSRQLKRLESISRSPIFSHFGETLSGASVIRAFKQTDRFIQESERRVDENHKSYYPNIVSNRWLAIRLEFVGNCIIFFAALFAVLARDTVSPGTVGLSISYALNVTQTLNWMVRMTSELETNIVSVERVKEYSEVPIEADWVIEDTRPPPEWPQSGKVDLHQYSVKYRKGLDLVLKDITCHIKPGEKVGLVGRTGAGKSSLTLGLFRILEAHNGAIMIDGIDISKLGLYDLRSKLTIIPQDPVLFSGSLRSNLDPFSKYSDEEVWKCLEYSHLKEFVKTLAEGLQHPISEGGENLSVGQRQLICLGRALLRKTKILVLDEATAAIDLETDDVIQSTIRTQFADCTIITIAHRLNTVIDYDRIMMLESGKVREFDSPQILLQDKSTLFYTMAKDAGLAD